MSDLIAIVFLNKVELLNCQVYKKEVFREIELLEMGCGGFVMNIKFYFGFAFRVEFLGNFTLFPVVIEFFESRVC